MYWPFLHTDLRENELFLHLTMYFSITNGGLMEDLMNNYEEILIKVDKDYEKINHQLNVISNLRLLVSVIGIIGFVISIVDKKNIYFVVFLLCCICFIGLLSWYEKLSENRDYLKAKQKVLTRQIARNTNNWSVFKDTGKDFLDANTEIEQDIDILGENSLYQYLSVCNTEEGRKRLSIYLKEGHNNAQDIIKKQQAVKEFMENEELALELETLSMMIGLKNGEDSKTWYESFLEFLHMDRKLLSTIVKKCAIIMPISALVSLLLVLMKIVHINVLFVLIILQLIISYYISFKNSYVTKKVYQFCDKISSYCKIIKYIDMAKFNSKYLKELQGRLQGDTSLTIGLEKLNHLNEAFLLQRNPYIHIPLQMLTMYDLHCMNQLDKWKSIYGKSITELFFVVGEIEALLSLSVLARDKQVVFPKIEDRKSVLFEGQDMAHPLISSDFVVKNSILMECGIDIITGSNMSGKTTFLRTIGVNVVLAYAGAPVCAKSMRLSCMKLFTSMRVQDDVSKGISSFYAEVLRIREMVEYSKRQKPMLVLIDEIFKGTNSADRITGAKEILKGLNKDYIIAVVSTHDFELCSLVEDKEIKGKNHHFEEYYEKDNIFFDYKIKDGRCRTTNARHILRMAGLIE